MSFWLWNTDLPETRGKPPASVSRESGLQVCPPCLASVSDLIGCKPNITLSVASCLCHSHRHASIIGSVQRLTGVERRKQSVGSCKVRPAWTPLAGFITPRVRDYQDITLQVTVDPTTTQDPGSHECWFHLTFSDTRGRLSFLTVWSWLLASQIWTVGYGLLSPGEMPQRSDVSFETYSIRLRPAVDGSILLC